MNKFLLFILLCCFTFITKGQEVTDTSETVMLEVRVFDEDSITPLDSVKISIVGTDLSQKTYFTNKQGFISIELKLEIAYVIIAIKNDYLNGKKKLFLKKSSFNKNNELQFYLEKVRTLVCFLFPKFHYLENQAEREFKGTEEDSLLVFGSYIYNNPTFVLELTAVRSENEPKKISKKRAEKIINELVAEGIEKDRLVFKDGGIGENEKEEDNRYIVFRVIKTDYVPNSSKK
mgnify:CR=1 FL=1